MLSTNTSGGGDSVLGEKHWGDWPLFDNGAFKFDCVWLCVDSGWDVAWFDEQLLVVESKKLS